MGQPEFRFLVNTDDCLNMSIYDFFFYKMRAQKRLHIISDVNMKNGSGDPFSHAASEISNYCDRNFSFIGDYQIIIAMRAAKRESISKWEDTLLIKLLRIDNDLRRAGIYINSGGKKKIAVNLFMLYDAAVILDLKEPDLDYFGSDQFKNECILLLRELRKIKKTIY